MKLRGRFTCQSGSALLGAILITALIGLLLATYLTAVRSQNTFTARSQAWNAAVPVIEAGIEDALAHLSLHGATNLGCDGWQLINGQYIIQRHVGGNFYIVGISNGTVPLITAQGYVTMPFSAAAPQNVMFATATPPISSTHLGRGVRLRARRDSLWAKGLVAKGQINMNGNNIRTDSYDSSDPAYSTNGRYDSTKIKDHGDVATNSGLTNSLNVGNADILGHVSTGPGGSVSIGANGSVGNKAWYDGGNHGVQPGYSSDDMNVSFPDVAAPFSGGAWTPSGGTVGGVSYEYVLSSGNYQLASLNMSGQSKMIVTGDAVLYVTGNASMSGQAKLELATNASLKFYVGGASASLGGSGVINNSHRAEKFSLYGLPANTSLSLGGNAEFTGIIYAPNADLSLSGGGSSDTDFCGASISKTVTLNGHFKFHYDEALQALDASRGFIVTAWDEMSPWELAALETYIGSNVQE